MPRNRIPKSKRSGVPGNSSAQSNQPETSPTPSGTKRTRFLGFLGIKSPSRSPSPRPPSSASTLPGQIEQQKPSQAPQCLDDVAFVPTEIHNQGEGSSGTAKVGPGKERRVPVPASDGLDEQHEDKIGPKRGPNEKQHNFSEKGGDKGLWDKAYDKLPDELKQRLVGNELHTLKVVLKTANDANEANIKNRLKLKWGDKEIDVQDTADRLLGWIAKFKEVGDIAVQYDPVHAALPWAGVRVILMVGGPIS